MTWSKIDNKYIRFLADADVRTGNTHNFGDTD